jgi:hypothetical protein
MRRTGKGSGGRQPWAIALTALSVAFVVLVIGIVVVLVVRVSGPDRDPAASGTGGSPEPAMSASTAPSIVAGLDPCVVGVWQYTLIQVTDRLGNGNRVTFAGSGGTRTMRPDGTGMDDFAGGVDLSVTEGGRTFTVTLRYSTSFRYTSANQVLTYRDDRPSGTISIAEDGVRRTSTPATGVGESEAYTCVGARMTLDSEGNHAELRRR